jgi:hypothetical protein
MPTPNTKSISSTIRTRCRKAKAMTPFIRLLPA